MHLTAHDAIVNYLKHRLRNAAVTAECDCVIVNVLHARLAIRRTGSEEDPATSSQGAEQYCAAFPSEGISAAMVGVIHLLRTVWILVAARSRASVIAEVVHGAEAGDGSKREELLHEALGLHQRGNFDGAAECYSKLLQVGLGL